MTSGHDDASVERSLERIAIDTTAADLERAADERTTLVEMLDYYRGVLARKAAGLTSRQLAETIAPSDLSLGGLVFHMTLVEDIWFPVRFAGGEGSEPFRSAPWDDDPDWEFHSAHERTPAQLFDLYANAIDRSRAVIAATDDLDAVAADSGSFEAVTLRWILVHMIEEYARHCGHADLLREVVDGATGD